ncbi:hypothetical protein AB870_03585 [Pandoraea faecigallinarum]|uniref:Uncharacterized protein n=1 Tax=Pandoraea faecigallinarum TaxID=656179 RepID=A0A0H3WPH0_9BURK|nr:hypothetical protein [Pandoraea faecigallinarum]AKM29415.1 hypothetical protein AB870_03585 [Pandoraea faecigallinarum]
MPDLRIPIREWSKSFSEWRRVDEWRLVVTINGTDLYVCVDTPADRYFRASEIPREYIVQSVAKKIGAVIADEIQRSIS